MQNILNILEQKLSFINGLYDYMRVVNPINKTVFTIDQYNNIKELKVNCFDYWKKNKVCQNCISMRAFYNNEIVVKIENNNEKSVIVMALPINVNGIILIVEILKDIDNTDRSADELDRVIAALNKEIGTDDFTQLYNRNYIESRLPVDIYNSSKSGDNINIALISCEEKDVLKISEILKQKCKSDKNLYAASFGKNNIILVLLDSYKSDVDEALSLLNNFKTNCSVLSSEDKELDYKKIISSLDERISKMKCSLDVQLLSQNIEIVNSKMENLRDILNEMCSKQTEDYEDILYVSQCLDKAIVSYMNLINKKNMNI